MNTSGYVYIISHPCFGNDTYKLGFTQKKKILMQRYRTYYPKDPTIQATYQVSNARLAERLVFRWLQKKRVHPTKEFFCEKLETIIDFCNRMQTVVNLTASYMKD